MREGQRKGMEMKNNLMVKGVWAAMMTPYDEKGMASEDGVKEFMEFFLDKKLDGIFPVSNVGEFATLTFEEKRRIIEICVSMGKGKMKVCPGVTDLNLDRALELAEFSCEQGADGVIISSPYYYPYGNTYIEEYLRIFLKESPLPVIIYHSPRFSNPISETFLLEILKHPNVAAVKESSGDARFLISLLERIKREEIDVEVMLGWEELLLTGLVHGASGCITSCGGIVPEILRKVYDSWTKGDMESAAFYQQSISRITRVLGEDGLPYGYKMGMAARIPQRMLQSRHMNELENQLQLKAEKIKGMLDQELSLLESKQPCRN